MTSSSYLRRLQEAAAAAAAATQQHSDSASDNDIDSPISSLASPSQNGTVLSNINSRSPSFFHESTVNQINPLPSLTIPPSRYPIAADAFLSHYTPQSAVRSSPRSDSSTNDQGIHCSNSHPQPKVEEHSYISSPSESFSTYPLYNWSYKQHQLLSIPAPTTVPPLSYYYRPRRLDEIAPRETIFLIIALFFDFVYPLTPCIHKQSFMADLHSRREERDPLFFALVMSTLSSTLVQLPRSYLPMDRPVVRKLAQVSLFMRFFYVNLAQFTVRMLTKQVDILPLLLMTHQRQCMLLFDICQSLSLD